MRPFFFIAFLLVLVFHVSAFATEGEESQISYKGNYLMCGKTYTSAEFSGIKSGSMRVSDDGTELTFDELNIRDVANSSGLISLHADKNDITIRLKGENKITISGAIVMALYDGKFTFTGSGSLTTSSYSMDFLTGGGSEIVIDNTTLISEGSAAFLNQYRDCKDRIIVKSSTFKGKKLIGLESLTLIQCAFVLPSGGAYFDQSSKLTQLKDANGNDVEYFEIQPVEGDYANRVIPSDFGNVIVAQGRTKTVNVSMRNVGDAAVSNISYVLSVDGTPQPEQIFTLSEASTPASLFQVPVLFTASSTPGIVNVAITVTKINGNENTSERKTASGILNTLVSGISSAIQYRDEFLVCGHTYTSADLCDIQSGSLAISDNGKSMVFDNLYIDNPDAIFKSSYNNDCVITLKGHSHLYTSSIAMDFHLSTLTLTGGGSLTTKAAYFDIYAYNTDITIENVSLTCNGNVAIGDNMLPTDNVIVRNSTVKGKRIVRIGSLTLIDCAFTSPQEVFFHPDLIYEMGGIADAYLSQLSDVNGQSINEFEIHPVEGDFSNRVSSWNPLTFDDVIVGKGETTTVDIKMKNDGEEPISEVSYQLSVDGIALPEQTYVLSKPNVTTGKAFFVPVTFPSSEKAETVEAVITITKVNGKENTSDRKTVKGIIATIDGGSTQRVVVEEYTGTWCGWCPRGMAAIDLLNKDFGDSVITICVHNDDPMVSDTYPAATVSFPGAEVNRGDFIDPYFGFSGSAYGIKDDVSRELNKTASVAINLTANWADEGETIIEANTETTFLVETDVSQYGIAYALLEDNMKGTGSKWAQNNFYSNTHTNDPNLQPYTQLPSAIAGLEYDYVAVAGWGINHGMDDCFETLQKYVPQKNTYQFDISDNTLIQDKSQLSFVAMLIDRKTGKIVNAAKSVIDKHDGADVKNLQVEKSRSSVVYTVTGQKVANSSDELAVKILPHGLYIVDGRKIIVR